MDIKKLKAKQKASEKRWKTTLLKYQSMPEKEFTEYCREQYNSYLKHIKHEDDWMPFYEYYLETAATYRRKVNR
jgi:hypothetical protein